MANLILTCIGKIPHRTRQPYLRSSMSWEIENIHPGEFASFVTCEKLLTHYLVFLEGSGILAANSVGDRSLQTSLETCFRKLEVVK